MKLEGFARVQITEKGEIKGDSGWIKNVITDYGLDECIGQLIVGGAGSVRVSALALGSGAAPATDASVLPNELLGTSTAAIRQVNAGATVTTSDGSGVTCRWVATFSSGDRTTAYTISNIGLYSNTSNTGIMAGQTYDSSNLSSTQDVNATYEWQFSTA
jgi:hypothetical protein